MRTWILLWLATTAAAAHATDNWPGYRGPGGQGHAAATNLPVRFGGRDHVVWKTAIPHKGWSTPVIWGKQVWLTTATPDGTEMYAIGVDRKSGEVLHRLKVFENESPNPINEMNSYASPSPVIERERVYVHFGTYGTAAIDRDTGDVVWTRRDLNLEHKEGPGSSPVLFRDLLIVHCDGMDVQYVVALDKKTGETVWKKERPFDYSGLREDLRKAYCTPLIVRINGQPRMYSLAAQGLVTYDPRTGEELWRLRYDGFSNVARPVFGHGMVYINTGFMSPELWAVRVDDGSSGDRVAWKHTRRIGAKPSPLLVGDELYAINDGGILLCFDAHSGEVVWKERLIGDYSASPVYADGHIYFLSQQGHVTVIEPGEEYREVAVTQMGSGFMASPAVAGDALYLRSKSHLYRLEK